MRKDELSEIYEYDVCPLCHDIMPDDPELRKVMHGENVCHVREATTERAKKILLREVR